MFLCCQRLWSVTSLMFDILRLGAFPFVHQVVFDPFPLVQVTVSLSLDGGIMYKNFLLAIVRENKSVSF